MGFNQVVRSAGFSVGSALSGLILSACTRPGTAFPADAGYGAAAWTGAAAMAATIALVVGLNRARDGAISPAERSWR